MFNDVFLEPARDTLKYLLSEGLHTLPTSQRVWEYDQWANVCKMLYKLYNSTQRWNILKKQKILPAD